MSSGPMIKSSENGVREINADLIVLGQLFYCACNVRGFLGLRLTSMYLGLYEAALESASSSILPPADRRVNELANEPSRKN